jgi:hypothetical protein
MCRFKNSAGRRRKTNITLKALKYLKFGITKIDFALHERKEREKRVSRNTVKIKLKKSIKLST